MFSIYYASRLDVTGTSGHRFDVENLRAACDSHTALVPDGQPADFSFLNYDLTKDSAPTPGSTTAAAGSSGAPPAATGPARSGQPRTTCPAASGQLSGARLGPERLGMSRAAVLHTVPRSSRRGRHNMDFLCFAYRGIRVGYPSPRLLRALPRRQAERVRGRAVLILTANPYYAVRGVHPGERLAAIHRLIRLERAFPIGRNRWYLALGAGAGRLLLKVRHGTVDEVGVANPRLTRNRVAARRFLRSFS